MPRSVVGRLLERYDRDMPEGETLPQDFGAAVSALPNGDLLAALDLLLLELERRLLRYAQRGAEILEMADEGLVLAARSAARLAQAQSAAAHAQSHLQLVGVGSWRPTSTHPMWGADPRVHPEEEQ
jgi:hypothetical protein